MPRRPAAAAATDTTSVAAARVTPAPVPDADDPGWVVVSRSAAQEVAAAPVGTRRILLRVLASLVAVVALVGLLGSLAAHRLAEREAVNDAANVADVLAEAVIQPALTQALVDQDPAAVAAMDRLVRGRVLGPGVVRVKLWSTDGTVLYADEPQLVGRRFPLSDDQRAVLASPATRAEVSDLQESENQFETGNRLVEVYRPVWTAQGEEVLFELYSPYAPVGERTGQLWRGFAGVTLSSLLLLVVLMVPVLWRLLRNLRDAQRQRESLLQHAVDASGDERRRVAATLHDGPVQELVATSYAVSGAAARAEAEGDRGLAQELSGLAATVRGSIRALRTLLVDIYPPSLEEAGLPSALADLVQTATTKGVRVDLDVDPDDVAHLDAEQTRLVYRVAQECLRNIAEHASPCRARVRLAPYGDADVLLVEDDGPGFDAALLRTPPAGHYGLRVLGDLASGRGAVLRVATAPGHGTRWELTIPRRPGPSAYGGAA